MRAPAVLLLALVVLPSAWGSGAGSFADAAFDETLWLTVQHPGVAEVGVSSPDCHDGAVDLVGVDLTMDGTRLGLAASFRDPAEGLTCRGTTLDARRERTFLYAVEVLDANHPLWAIFVEKQDAPGALVRGWFWRDGSYVYTLGGEPMGDPGRADLAYAGADPSGRAYDLSGVPLRVGIDVNARYFFSFPPFEDLRLHDGVKADLTPP